jgi:hypothetical protein
LKGLTRNFWPFSKCQSTKWLQIALELQPLHTWLWHISLLSMNPFHDALDHINKLAQSDPQSAQLIKSLDVFDRLFVCLSDQENKIRALDGGILDPLLLHYRALIKVQNEQQYCHTKLLVEARVCIVNIFTSLCRLSEGRRIMLANTNIGLNNLITLFQDPEVQVRLAASDLFTLLISAPDMRRQVNNSERSVFHAVINVFLNDSNDFVVLRIINSLQAITIFDPRLDSDTLKKLRSLLVSLSQDNNPNQAQLTLIKQILQTVWNSSIDLAQKLVIIEGQLVETLASVLLSSSHVEIQRLIVGSLASLTIQQAAKKIVISNDKVLELVSSFVLDNRVEKLPELRANSVLLLVNLIENPAGLNKIGGILVVNPEIALEIMNLNYLSRYISNVLQSRFSSLSAIECIYLLNTMQYCIEQFPLPATSKLFEMLNLLDSLYLWVNDESGTSDPLRRELSAAVLKSILHHNVEAKKYMKSLLAKVQNKEKKIEEQERKEELKNEAASSSKNPFIREIEAILAN